MRRVLGLFIFIAAIAGGIYFYFNFIQFKAPSPYSPLPNPQISASDIYQGVSYEAVDKSKYQVSLLSDKLSSPTRVKITPDGKHLLVTQISGELLAFDKKGDNWNSSPYLVAKVDTKFPGFPPDEAGLAGIILSSQYQTNGKIFLLYTYKDETGVVQNRINVVKITEKKGKLFGSIPSLIYQANVAGNKSHQITDGAGLMVQSKPHLMFLVGEGFNGKRAQNPREEGGKVMLIQEDGSDPIGPRPFVENPKVEAIGIRNAYVIAKNEGDSKGRYLIGDTGPDKYDRLIYTKLGSGEALKPVNFGWDGNQDSLAVAIPDPNITETADMAIFRFLETRTITGLAFPGKSNKLLITLFGQTGSPRNSPGKEIWLGELTNQNAQPKISFTPLIKRANEAEGKLGNPIGLEVDSATNDFFFADILEGRLYLVRVNDTEETIKAQIEINNFKHSPNRLAVKTGGEVTVTNKDVAGHTVTGDTEGLFDTGLIGRDETKTFRAPLAPGEYPYHCTPHPFMKGVLVIEE